MSDHLCPHGVSILLVCQQCHPGVQGVNLSDLRDGRQPAMSILPDGRPPFVSMLPPAGSQWVVFQPQTDPPRMSLLEFQHSDHPVAQEDVVRQATEEIAKWTRVVALLETFDTFIDCALGTEQIGARQDAIHLIEERIAFFQQLLTFTREQQAGIRFLLASAFALARASVVPAKPEGDTNV